MHNVEAQSYLVRNPGVLQISFMFALAARRRSPFWCYCVVRSCNARGFTAQADPRDGVVKIFNTRQKPGWTVPWQMQPVKSTTGSGAVINFQGNGTRHVLTAAHVISDSRYLEIQRTIDHFSSEKFRSRVVAVCHEADLALLSIDSPALDGIMPFELAPADEVPRVFDKVRVVGFPIGGDAVCVTEGVVSRVEVQEYTHSYRSSLALTVDAAINSGNSGGPVLDATTNCILGVAFQKLVAQGVELQGHAVPAPLIHRFLDDARSAIDASGSDEHVQLRLPSLGCDYQTLESPALRALVGIDSSRSGVIVNRMHYVGGKSELRSGDVLLAFNNLELDNAGFCQLLGCRLHFAAARDLCRANSVVELRLWRDGHEHTIAHKLPPMQHLVHRGQYDCIPPYFICGGFVFQPLSLEYLLGWNVGDRPPHLQHLYLSGHVKSDRTEVVILSQVLSNEVNKGQASGWIGSPIVRALNGVPVHDLKHLISLIRRVRLDGRPDQFLRFDVNTSSGPALFVLPIDGLDKADEHVQLHYGVPALCSPDLATEKVQKI